jgi:hypothetical protein
MKSTVHKIVFRQGNSLHEMVCEALMLKKEKGTEVMYLNGVGKIDVDQVVSINGFRF